MTRRPGELPPEEKEILGLPPDPTPEQQAEAEKELKERAELRKAFLTGLMQNDLFRNFLMEQLVAMGTFDNSFGAGPTGFPDPLATWFQSGMKAAGWNLWCLFDDVAPEWSSLMRREHGKPRT